MKLQFNAVAVVKSHLDSLSQSHLVSNHRPALLFEDKLDALLLERSKVLSNTLWHL